MGSAEYKDYYQTLDIPRNASQDQIRKAFRALARQFHPDIASDDPRAEDRFKEINEAYEVLGDPVRRRKYNRIDKDYATRHPTRDDEHFEFRGTGFSDFFHDFFSRRGGGSSGPSSAAASQQEPGPEPEPEPAPQPEPEAQPQSTAGHGTRPGGEDAAAQPEGSEVEEVRGHDILSELMITLHEADAGTSKKISVTRPDPLGGSPGKEVYQVKVPPGIREGQVIRLAGKGRPGPAGAPPGDLLMRVRFARHPDFEVAGSDLLCTIRVAPWDAVLGGEAFAPTLGKPIKVKIKPGTQSGRNLRIRGLGLVKPDGSRGDIIGQVQIFIPPLSGPQETHLWKKLKQGTRWDGKP